MNEIHPVPGLTDGTVPEETPPTHRHGRRPGRWRRIAAGAAIGLSLGAGAVAVAQAPLHDSHVGSVFSATQNPDDDTAEPPEAPGRSHVGTSQTHEDAD
jgi:hypothetical protein